MRMYVYGELVATCRVTISLVFMVSCSRGCVRAVYNRSHPLHCYNNYYYILTHREWVLHMSVALCYTESLPLLLFC